MNSSSFRRVHCSKHSWQPFAVNSKCTDSIILKQRTIKSSKAAQVYESAVIHRGKLKIICCRATRTIRAFHARILDDFLLLFFKNICVAKVETISYVDFDLLAVESLKWQSVHFISETDSKIDTHTQTNVQRKFCPLETVHFYDLAFNRVFRFWLHILRPIRINFHTHFIMQFFREIDLSIDSILSLSVSRCARDDRCHFVNCVCVCVCVINRTSKVTMPL